VILRKKRGAMMAAKIAMDRGLGLRRVKSGENIAHKATVVAFDAVGLLGVVATSIVQVVIHIVRSSIDGSKRR